MERKEFENKIYDLFDINPVVAILGPRQCGKTRGQHRIRIIKHVKDLLFL